MALRFENLQVYQKALQVVDAVYSLTKTFPKEEQSLLVNQLRRAALSIALNIAEGSGRTKKEFQHFLNTSRTSSFECIAALTIAKRQGYISQAQLDSLTADITEVIRMLQGLKNSL